MCKKEKLLVTSNFSFSHSVFYLFVELSAIFIKSEFVVCKIFQFGRIYNLSFGEGLRRLSFCRSSVAWVKDNMVFWNMVFRVRVVCSKPFVGNHINSLPNDKFSYWSKLKAFADDKINVTGIGRKLCGQRRKCWFPAFSPFATIFSKGFFFPRSLKSGLCNRGLNSISQWQIIVQIEFKNRALK